MIYTDQEYNVISIEDIGIFEWKELHDDSKRNKKGLLIKESVNTFSLYNTLSKRKFTADEELIIDRLNKKFKDDLLSPPSPPKDEFNLGIGFFGSMKDFRLSHLFNVVEMIKSMPYKNETMSRLSETMKDLYVEKEGGLLVLCSKNKTLITLLIEKIASLGFIPINQLNLNDGDGTLYKFYYEDDSDEDNEDFDDGMNDTGYFDI